MNLDGTAPDEAYIAAQDLAASGKHADAIVAYSAALSGNSSHVAARIGRGLALQRIGEHLKALADFDNAISSCADWPGIVVAYYSRAVSRQRLGRTVEAIEDCDEVISRDPVHADTLYLRGTIWKELGHIETALGDMDAVLRIDSRYHEAYFVRGSLHYLQQHWEQAVADFTAAIGHIPARAPSLSECFCLRGMAAQQLGEHRLAIADFTQAIDLTAGYGAAYLRRSRSYNEIGESALAASDLQVGMAMLRAET